jgi:hypothetical protein
MATYKRKQADSLFIDLPFPAWSEIDNVWSNWSGLWSIRATLDDPVLLAGMLIRSETEGLFQLRIGPAGVVGWASLPVGQYILTTEVNNASADFRSEEQSKVIIEKQGVPNA